MRGKKSKFEAWDSFFFGKMGGCENFRRVPDTLESSRRIYRGAMDFLFRSSERRVENLTEKAKFSSAYLKFSSNRDGFFGAEGDGRIFEIGLRIFCLFTGKLALFNFFLYFLQNF